MILMSLLIEIFCNHQLFYIALFKSTFQFVDSFVLISVNTTWLVACPSDPSLPFHQNPLFCIRNLFSLMLLFKFTSLKKKFLDIFTRVPKLMVDYVLSLGAYIHAKKSAGHQVFTWQLQLLCIALFGMLVVLSS